MKLIRTVFVLFCVTVLFNFSLADPTVRYSTQTETIIPTIEVPVPSQSKVIVHHDLQETVKTEIFSKGSVVIEKENYNYCRIHKYDT